MEMLEDRCLLIFPPTFTLASPVQVPPAPALPSLLISHASSPSGDPTGLDSLIISSLTVPAELRQTAGPYASQITLQNLTDPDAFGFSLFNVTATSSNTQVVQGLDTSNGNSPNLDVHLEFLDDQAYIRFAPGPAPFGKATVTINVQDFTGDTTTSQVEVRLDDPPSLDPLSNRTVLEDSPPVTVPLSGITAGLGSDNPLNGGQNRMIYADTTNPYLTGIPLINYDASAMDKLGTLQFSPVKGQPTTVDKLGDNEATITVTVEDAGVDNVLGKIYHADTGKVEIVDPDATLDNQIRTQSFRFTIIPVNDPPTVNDVRTSTTTLSAISSDTVTVADPRKFPNTATPSFEIEIDSERMLVTNVSGNLFTVTRGYDGTVAASHALNSTVTLIDYVVFDEDDPNAPTIVDLTGITPGGGTSIIGNEQQKISVTPVNPLLPVNGGFFTLTFQKDATTHSFTTDLIPYNASPTTSQDETLNFSDTANTGTFTMSMVDNVGAVTSLDDSITDNPAVQTTFNVDDLAGFPTSPGFVIAVDGEQMLVTGILASPVSGNSSRKQLTVQRGYHGTTITTHPDYASVIEIRDTQLLNPTAVLPNSRLSQDLAGVNQTTGTSPTTLRFTAIGGPNTPFPAIPADSLAQDALVGDTFLFISDVSAFPAQGPFRIRVVSATGDEDMIVTSVDTTLGHTGFNVSAPVSLMHTAGDAVLNPFVVRVDREEMLVTSHTNTQMTVVRGYNGTAISSHGNGTSAVFPQVTQVDDVITVEDPAMLSSLPTTQKFIRIGAGATLEELNVTGVFGNQLMVTRGIHGTTLKAHNAGDRVGSVQTTKDLIYNASASEIQNALAALKLVGTGNVEVLGAAQPYSVHFKNQLGKRELDSIVVDGGELNFNEKQQFQFSGTNFSGTGTFTLSFGGGTTAPIPFDATADEIRMALEAIPGNIINPGDVIVGPTSTTTLASGAITIEFTGQYANQNVAQVQPIPNAAQNIGVNNTLINHERQFIGIGIDPITGSPIGAIPTGGTFQLTFRDPFSGVTFTTAQIQYDTTPDNTALNIESALDGLTSVLGVPLDVKVTASPTITNLFTVEFVSSSLSDVNVGLLFAPPANAARTTGNLILPSPPAIAVNVAALEDGNQFLSGNTTQNGRATSASAFETVAGALSIYDALTSLQSVTTADIRVTSTSAIPTDPINVAPVLVEFTGQYAGLDVNLITHNDSPLPASGLSDFNGQADVTDDVNAPFGVVDIKDRHFDGETQRLTYIAVSDNPDVVPNPIPIYSSPQSTGQLQFVNNTDQFGDATITLTVIDSGFDQNLLTLGDNGVTTKLIHVRVKPTNDLPTITPLPDLSVPKNSSPIAVLLKGISAGGSEGQDLKITATSSNPALLPDPSIVYTNGSATGQMTLAPIAGAVGTAIITVTVEDAGVDLILNTTADNAKRRVTFRFDASELPTITGVPASISIAEDSVTDVNQPLSLTNITAGGTESQNPNPQPLQLLASNSNASLFVAPANLSLTTSQFSGVAPPGGFTSTLNFVPTGQLSGTDVFHLTLSDSGPDRQLGTPGQLTANATATTTSLSVTGATVASYTPIPRDKLLLDVGAGDTTVTLADASAFPATLSVNPLDPTTYFKIQIGNEVMTVTSITDGALPSRIFAVIRGEDGTTAVTHKQNDAVVEPFKIRIDNEILRVIGITGNNLTVVRGIDGTTAAAHAAPSVIVHPQSFDNLTITRDIAIQVTPVNDKPTLDVISPNPFAPGSLTIPEGSGEQIVSLSGITDGEGIGARQHLRVVATSSNPALTGPIAVVYNDGDAAGSLRFTPAANVSGTAGITVTVFDGGKDNDLNTLEGDLSDEFSRTLNLTVVAIGDLPTINAISNRTISEDASTQTVNLSNITDGDGNTQDLLVTVVTADTSSSSGVVGTLTSALSTGATTLTLTNPTTLPAAPFTIQVEQEQMQVTSVVGGTLTLTRGVNGTTAVVHSGSLASPLNVRAILISNLTLNYNPLNLQPTTGGTPPTTGTLTFVPGADRFGSATVTVTVTDGGNDTRLGIDKLAFAVSTTGATSVVVTNATRFPASAPFNIVIDNEEMTVSAVSGSTFTVLAGDRGLNGTTAAVHSSGAIVIAPNTVADNVSFSRAFTVTVNPVNDAPRVLAPPTPLTISETAGLQTINLTGIDAGPFESQNLSISATSSNTDLIPTPTVSYTSPNSTAAINFQPTAFKAGSATLTIKIMDAGLDGNLGTLSDNAVTTKTVVVNVGAVNDPPTLNPVALASSTLASAVNATATTLTVANASTFPSTASPTFTIRIDSEQMTVTAVSGNTFTVLRHANGTTAASHVAGAAVTKLVLEDSGENSVALTGITAGPLESQILKVTPSLQSSSIAGLITNLSVDYASPNSTGTLKFTPGANLYGTATIRVTVEDAGFDGVLATAGDNATFYRDFFVTVTNIEDAPTLAQPPNATINKNGYLINSVTVTGISDGDLNSQTLTVTATSDNPALVPNPTVNFTQSGTTPSTALQSATLVFNPAPNQLGTANITVKVSDGVSFVTKTFLLTVANINLPPTIDPPTPNSFSLNEGDGLQSALLSGISGGGTESQLLQVSATADNPAAFQTLDVFYNQGSMDAAGSLSFTPSTDAAGSFTITVKVTDAGANGIFGDSDDNFTTTPITVNIAQGNDDPPTLDAIANKVVGFSASPTLQTVNLTGISAGPFETGSVSVIVLSNSNPVLVPGPTVNYTSGSTGTLTFTPAASSSGVANITVRVTDSGSNTFDRSFSVYVVNPPTINNISNPSAILEDTPGIQTVNLSGVSDGDSGVEGGTISVSSNNPSLFSSLIVTPTDLSSATPAVNYTLSSDANGTATVMVTLTDNGPDGVASTGDEASVSKSFVVTVNPDNDQPTLTAPATLTLTEDGGTGTINLTNIFAKSGALLDEAGQPLRVTAISADTSKVVVSSINYTSPASTGSVVVAPVTNASGGPVNVTITVEDGGTDNNLSTPADNKTFSAVVAVTVNAVNDKPTLNAISNVTVNEDSGTGSVNLTGITAGTGESQALTVTAVSDNQFLIPDGNLSVIYTSANPTGTLQFTPLGDASGDAFITVTVTDDNSVDGTPQSFSQTFKIHVNEINDPPVFEPASDTVSIDEGLANGTEVLDTGVVDPEGLYNTLSFSIISGNTNNAFSIDSEGIIRVAKSSAVDFETTPTFTLTVKVVDNAPIAPSGQSATHTFTVTLNDLTEVLKVNSSNWPSNGLLTLKRTLDGKVHVLNSSNVDVVPAHFFANVSDIQVTGRSAAADVLTLDYSNGDPIPAGGLTFDGAAGLGDAIKFSNAAFGELDTTFVSATSASIADPAGPISVVGTEGITFDTTVSAANLNFVYGSANDAITFADDGVTNNGLSNFSSSSSPVVTFAATSGLTINTGDGNNSVTFNSLELPSGPAVTVIGGSGNDLLKAQAVGRAVSLSGGAGNDTLIGGGGADTLQGEADDDVLTGGFGNDSIDGGTETNTLYETGDVNLTLGANSLSGLGADALLNIQFAILIGGASNNSISAAGFGGQVTINGAGGNDTLVGSSQDDVLTGSDGNDQIDGGGGADTLIESGNVNFTLGSSTMIGLGTDSISNIEAARLTGGTGNNTLDASGFGGSVTLFGGAGNDILKGGLGGDLLSGDAGNDTLTGNGGTNTLNGGTETDQVFESGNLDFLLLTAQLSSSVGTDDLNSIEVAKLVGGSGDNTLDASGFVGKTTLQGGDGADTLLGGSNADSLDGGNGNDALTGGLGNDTFVGGTGSDAIVESNVTALSFTATSMSGRGSDLLTSIESASITGTSGNDVVSGGAFAGNLTINGLGGNDSLTGGNGNDTILGGDGADVLNGASGNDFIQGEAGNDRILGGAGNDQISGGDGNDTLSGQAGNDTMVGGDGNDSILGGDNNDAIDGQAGNDTISGDNGNDTVIGGVGKDSILGAAGNDFLYDGDFLSGTSDGEKDTLRGALGTDTLIGQSGSPDFDVLDDAAGQINTAFSFNTTTYNTIFGALLGP